MPKRKSAYHEQLQETHEEIIVHKRERRILRRHMATNRALAPMWAGAAGLLIGMLYPYSLWLAIGGISSLLLSGIALWRRRFFPLEVMFSVCIGLFVFLYFALSNSDMPQWTKYGMGALMGSLAFGVYWSTDYMVGFYRQHHDQEHTHVERLESRLHESRSAYARRTTKNQRYRNKSGSADFKENEWMDLCFRYDYTCLRCERKEPDIMLTPDHVIPLARGGTNTIDNIQPLCLRCNTSKNARHIDYRGGDA